MVIFDLRWFCAAFLFVPVVAQANKVSTEVVSGSTSYKVIKETVSAPLGSTIKSPRDINSVPMIEKMPSGGLSQAAKGSLYIAEKKASFDFSGKFKFAKETINGGAKKLLKLNPLGLAGTVGLMGLDKLLRDHGWEPYEDGSGFSRPGGLGGNLDGTYDPSKENTYEADPAYNHGVSADDYFYYHRGYASTMKSPDSGYSIVGFFHKSGISFSLQCKSSHNGYPIASFNYTYNSAYVNCYYNPKNPDDAPKPPLVKASDSDVDDLVDGHYDSDVSDWPAIFPYIEPDSFELDPIPSFSFPPITSTSTNVSTGLVTTVESQTVLDFQVDNSTATPSITITESETSTKYEDGVKVDETTTVVPSAPSQPSTGGGGVTGADDAFELPSFCSWASVVCNWIGWTKELPDGSEPDLSSLVNDDDFTRDYTISFGTKQCPAPMQLNVALLKDPIEISFDPFCELAGYLYYFVMVSAYLIAIRISLGVARDG